MGWLKGSNAECPTKNYTTIILEKWPVKCTLERRSCIDMKNFGRSESRQKKWPAPVGADWRSVWLTRRELGLTKEKCGLTGEARGWPEGFVDLPREQVSTPEGDSDGLEWPEGWLESDNKSIWAETMDALWQERLIVLTKQTNEEIQSHSG